MATSGRRRVQADQIKRVFNRKQWDVAPDGYVCTQVASVKTPFSKPQGGFFRFIIDGSFHYYHRDPRAGLPQLGRFSIDCQFGWRYGVRFLDTQGVSK
jgi:hypothetical protein